MQPCQKYEKVLDKYPYIKAVLSKPDIVLLQHVRRLLCKMHSKHTLNVEKNCCAFFSQGQEYDNIHTYYFYQIIHRSFKQGHLGRKRKALMK